MARSYRSPKNRQANTPEQEQNNTGSFFSKTPDNEFFGIQRLSTREDDTEPATNDQRMALDKQIQTSLVPLVIMEPRRVGSGSVVMGPGISVSWNGNSMHIIAHMEASGPAATPEIAQTIQDAINRVWNQSFADGYSVTCSADVTYRAADVAEDSGKTQINVVNEPGTTHVRHAWLVGARYMTFNLYDSSESMDWTPAHEFGHLIGLRDHYSEGIGSKLGGRLFGWERHTDADEGWSGNIMAESGGLLESKNIQEWLEIHGVQYVMPGTPATPTEA